MLLHKSTNKNLPHQFELPLFAISVSLNLSLSGKKFLVVIESTVRIFFFSIDKAAMSTFIFANSSNAAIAIQKDLYKY